MPRTNVSPHGSPNKNTGAGQALTMTTPDVSNHNQFTASGNDAIIAHNTDTGPQTVTVISAPDALGRTGDVTHTLVANERRVIRVGSEGWVQADGKIYIDASSTLVKFAVVQL